MQPVGQATCKERLDCRQLDSVPHGRVRRKDVQYEEMKLTLRPHRTLQESDGVHAMREPLINWGLTLPWSQGELWKDFKQGLPRSALCFRTSVFQQGGRKVTSEEGGLPVMCPQRRHLCQSPARGGHKKGALLWCSPTGSVFQKSAAGLKGPLCCASLRIAQSCPPSVRISQKSRSTGLMQPPMAWFGTSCLTDWPQLGSLPQALCSYTQPPWSHIAWLWVPAVWPWVQAGLITCSGPLSPHLKDASYSACVD